MTPILEIQGVTKFFGGVVANDDITMAIPHGKIIGLIGPNGSGKTTLFNSIVGFHPVDRGSIRFEGKEISKLRIPQIARLGLLRTFQQTRIFGRMTCMDNMRISVSHMNEDLRTMFSAFPEDVNNSAEALLEFVGLYPKRFLRAGELSFGQQKLLELAMALMNQPKMLLLDEPTAGIHPNLINSLVDRLKKANAEMGITLFVIEHNMRVIMNLAEHIYCMSRGRLLADGPPDRIRKDHSVIDAYLGGH